MNAKHTIMDIPLLLYIYFNLFIVKNNNKYYCNEHSWIEIFTYISDYFLSHSDQRVVGNCRIENELLWSKYPIT